MSRDRSRSPKLKVDESHDGHDQHFNLGPAETALGFPTEVIDAHAYVLPEFDAATGLGRAEKLRLLQHELGTHHTFVKQTAPGKQRFVDNSSLVDPKTSELQKNVSWSRDNLGRPCWEVDGCRFIKGNCPPHVQTQGNSYSTTQLLAAMDFADVSVSILHTYPTYGDLSALHREACFRYPERFRRIIYFPDLMRVPDDMDKLLARVDAEIAAGGTIGLQFFTGWFEGDWDGANMKAFWDHLAKKRVTVWFTCVLGNAQQFGAAEDLFAEDYDKVIAWCKRYPDSNVVLTHGLPWRICLKNNNTEMGLVPSRLLKVFECPRVHVQLLIPLRIGDVFDFPFRQANGMLEQLARAVGVDRLLYGTDMPMVERYCTYSQSVTHIARYCDFLTPSERALVLGGNARRLIQESDAAMKALSIPQKIEPARCPLARAWVDVRMPAIVGQRTEDLDTPCLLVDLDAFDANCATMNQILKPFANQGVSLRPHAKPHKSSSLAARQLRAHGTFACGVCCQTVTEAELMVRNGVLDVLLTNIIADPIKANRLASLSLSPGSAVHVCIDSLHSLALFKEALKVAPGARLGIMIELGVASRTGVEPDASDVTVCLAKEIAANPGLWLRGLQVYNGFAQHLRTVSERKSAILESNSIAKKHLAALQNAGISGINASELIVSGGGIGTLPLEVEVGCWRELQAGSYIFNDRDYSDNKDMAAWRQSLFVLGSIIGSYSRPGAIGGPHVIVDVGLKSVAFDSGPPVPWSPCGKALEYENLGDEHGAVRFPHGSNNVSNGSSGGSCQEELALGTKIKLTPGHCDPTVNLYDFLVGVRGGVVEEIFRVDARSY